MLLSAGNVASFQHADSDLQYLSLIAAAALERQPQSLLLLVSPTDTDSAKKGQTGIFLLAGPSGEVSLTNQAMLKHAASWSVLAISAALSGGNTEEGRTRLCLLLRALPVCCFIWAHACISICGKQQSMLFHSGMLQRK